MNKRQVLVFSLLSALIVSGFGIVNALAASSGTNNSVDKAAQLEERYGITLTDEQKTQIEAKEQEQETKKAEELAKWENMTLDTWKAQEIERINATTQEDFDKMKERQLNMLENGKGGPMGEPKDMGEKPAE
jgi:Zn-dependent M16 (insulinase) family peptidase